MDVGLTLLVELARAVDAGDPHAAARGMQDYVIRLDGGGFRETQLKWDRELDALLERVRRPGRAPEDVAKMGVILRAFLAPADWTASEAAILEAVGAHQRVVLTVRCAAAELFALPWELLSLRDSGRHLGELPGMLIRYCWPETRTVPAAPVPRTDDSRVLFAWSDAGGRVPAVALQERVTRAAQAGSFALHPDRDVVPHATTEALRAALAERPVSVLVLLAHGAAAGATFGLTLDDGEGGRVVVDAAGLRQLLVPHAASLRLVVLAACDGGNMGARGNALGSIAQNLHRGGIQGVVASRFPLSVRGAGRMVDRLMHGLLVSLWSLERCLADARQALLELDDTLDWASLVFYARPEDGDDSRPIVVRPYRGLLAFGPRQHRLFFGRDAERAELASDLAALAESGRPRFLVVAGASGTGKSSVVLAGAVPDLTREVAELAEAPALDQAVERVRALLSPFDLPAVRQSLSSLEAAVRDGGERALAWRSLRPGADPLGALDGALAGRDPDRELLLVVDQLEEIFTHCTDPQLRTRFCRRLWSLAQGESGVAVICTVRVDFLGRCGEVVLDEAGLRLDRVAYDERHRVFVAQMARYQLRECIERPAAQLGLVLEAGLAERMVDDVGAEPGALPLLSYTLDQLWERRVENRLTAASYEELGGVGGALQQKADALVDGLDEEEARVARRVLVRLVGRGESGARDTRRRVALETLRPSEDAAVVFDRVVAGFVDRRLLVRGEDKGEATLEVAHEALIRKWARLQRWLAEDLEMLAELDEVERFVVPWEEYGTLLEGDQLGYARQVAGRYPAEVSAELQDLISQSETAIARSRLFKRVALTSAFLVMAFLVVGSLRLMDTAIKAELESSVRSQLAVAGVARGSNSATVQLALLREIHRLDDHAHWLSVGVPAMLKPRVLSMRSAAQRVEGLLGASPGESGAGWTYCLDDPDNPALIGQGADGTRTVAWLVGGRSVALSSCTAVGVAPDGSGVAAIDAQGRVLWAERGAAGAPPAVVGHHPGADWLAFDSESPRWVTGPGRLADQALSTRLWTPAGAAGDWPLGGTRARLDGRWLTTRGGDSHGTSALLWDLATGSPQPHVGCGSPDPRVRQLDAVGRLWEITESPGRVVICDAVTGVVLGDQPVRWQDGESGPALSTALGPLRGPAADVSPGVVGPGIATASGSHLRIWRASVDPSPWVRLEAHSLDEAHGGRDGGASPNHFIQAMAPLDGGGVVVAHRCGAVSRWQAVGGLQSQNQPFRRPPGEYSVHNWDGLPARPVGPVVDGAVRWMGARWRVGEPLSTVPEDSALVIDGLGKGRERLELGQRIGDSTWRSPSGARSVVQAAAEDDENVFTASIFEDGRRCGAPVPVDAPWSNVSWSADERFLLGRKLSTGTHRLVRVDCDGLQVTEFPPEIEPRGFVSGTNELVVQGIRRRFDLTPGVLLDELWTLTDYCLPVEKRELLLGESRPEALLNHRRCEQAVAADQTPPGVLGAE